MIYYFDSVYVIGGLALLFLILLAFLKFMKRKSNMYLLCFSVMYIYLCVVLDLTQFPIYASEGMKAAMGGQNVWREMNLIPLKTIVTDFSMESVLNIIVTIPLGFGLSFLMRCSWRQIMLSGLLVGGCAEAGQLLTALWVGFTFRHVNIDDILLNIIGVLLGYGVFKIFRDLKKKMTVIDKVFPEEIRNFLKVVCKYQRMDLIEDIFAAYDRYCDEQNQVLNAVLTCTVPPSEEQKKGMEAFLCKKYGAKKAKIEVCQDQALLGGFILRVGSDEYDWSMKGRLNRLEQRLTWR